MLTKVLAGVLAAVAVTGAGIFFATSDCQSGGCPIRRALQGDTSNSNEQPSCCSMPVPTSCSETQGVPNDSLGACLGGSTLAASQSKPAAITCCPVE